jgi:S-adenosylmethionine:tRNA ribosyltransferase-isomerase
LFDLKRQGIDTAQIVLYTGLSSYMDDDVDASHLASEEEYLISEETAKKIDQTHRSSGRVIAVGTTVVRALESAVDEMDRVKTQHNYTRLFPLQTPAPPRIDLLTRRHVHPTFLSL